MAIRGFGQQEIELTEFEPNKSVRNTPKSKMFSGGHRFTFTDEGDKTTVHHELEMNPKGLWVLMSPMMGMMASRNLRKTADALQRHLERGGDAEGAV